jgi:hypothetical protein
MNQEEANFDIDFQEHQREDVSLEELDQALINVREAELEHDEVNKVKKELYKKQEEAKAKLISLLAAAGKDRWEVSGYKGFTMYDELSFKVPDGPMNKAEFFKFIKSERVCELFKQTPEDMFLTYVTVHSGKLNTLCKEVKKLAAAEGEDIQIPGLAAPKSQKKLRSLPKVKA